MLYCLAATVCCIGINGREAGVDFLAFPPINIGERYKKIFDLRKVISQSEIPFDLKQLHQLSVGL